MYNVFAEFYDGLTQNVDYSQKADYILKIFENFGHAPGTVLDLACGTGSLAIELKKRGVDVFGVDSSEDMLTQAQMKAYENEVDIMFIKQKMQSLNLFGNIDSCVCTLDSLNHLQGEEQFKKAVERVSCYLDKDGVFVFDINTPYKHEKVLGMNTFVYDTDEVFLVWQNTFRKTDCSVNIELDFFAPCEKNKYQRYSESFREFAYPLETVEKILNENSLNILAVYHDTTFEEPKTTSDRLTVVAIKN